MTATTPAAPVCPSHAWCDTGRPGHRLHRGQVGTVDLESGVAVEVWAHQDERARATHPGERSVTLWCSRLWPNELSLDEWEAQQLHMLLSLALAPATDPVLT